jgi:anti-sigma B factor antagonist
MEHKAEAGQLSVTSRMAETVMVIDLTGTARQGGEVTTLRQFLRERLDEMSPRVLLNFQAVQFMDSSGLGAIVEARAHAIAIGTQLRCSDMPSPILKMFYQLRLETVMEMYDTEQEALANWG